MIPSKDAADPHHSESLQTRQDAVPRALADMRTSASGVACRGFHIGRTKAQAVQHKGTWASVAQGRGGSPAGPTHPRPDKQSQPALIAKHIRAKP